MLGVCDHGLCRTRGQQTRNERGRVAQHAAGSIATHIAADRRAIADRTGRIGADGRGCGRHSGVRAAWCCWPSWACWRPQPMPWRGVCSLEGVRRAADSGVFDCLGGLLAAASQHAGAALDEHSKCNGACERAGAVDGRRPSSTAGRRRLRRRRLWLPVTLFCLPPYPCMRSLLAAEKNASQTSCPTTR